MIGLASTLDQMIQPAQVCIIFLRVNYKNSYVTYCKLYPLSSIITENVLDVCKLLQVMSFRPNSVNFCG
ncbi:hypothetical protein Hanom_Chr02g00135741 [Helianthus anomalus]